MREPDCSEEERNAALSTWPDCLGSLARAIVGPSTLFRILPSSKAVSGLIVSPYLPRIPELPNWSDKTTYSVTASGTGAGISSSIVGFSASPRLRGIESNFDFLTPTCLNGQTFLASL